MGEDTKEDWVSKRVDAARDAQPVTLEVVTRTKELLRTELCSGALNSAELADVARSLLSYINTIKEPAEVEE